MIRTKATLVDLSNEIDAYQEDNTGAVEPADDELVGLSSTIGLDEPVVVTIHTQNTHLLKSKMFDSGLITIKEQYKIPYTVGLRNSIIEMRPHNPPWGFVTIMEDILRCGIQVPLLSYFQKLLEYYEVSPMQLTPNSYRQIATLLMAYKQLGFPKLTIDEFAFIYSFKENMGDHGFYHSSKWYSRNVKAFWNIKSNMGQWKGHQFQMECPTSRNFRALGYLHFFPLLYLFTL